jgi:hypothetical protein
MVILKAKLQTAPQRSSLIVGQKFFNLKWL